MGHFYYLLTLLPSTSIQSRREHEFDLPPGIRSVNPMSSTFERSGLLANPTSIMLSMSSRCQVMSCRLNSFMRQSFEGPSTSSLTSHDPSASFKAILKYRCPACLLLHLIFEKPVKSTLCSLCFSDTSQCPVHSPDHT